MAKGAYVGVGGVARKVKKIYIGVGGVARKVKKGYIGVGGVARLFFTSEPLYAGTAAPLSVARAYLAGASNAYYAAFASGSIGLTDIGNVDYYDAKLVKGLLTSPNAGYACHHLEGAGNGSYVIFAGGTTSDLSDTLSSITAFNTSMTRFINAPTLYQSVYGHSALSFGYLAIFIGGWRYTDSRTDQSHALNAIDTSMVNHYNNYGLPLQRSSLGSARTNNYAIFAGGSVTVGSGTDVVDAYNSSLARAVPAKLPSAANTLTGATAGGYAVFINGPMAVAYDDSLVQHILASPASYMIMAESASVDKYAIFAGGSDGNNAINNVLMYDDSLVASYASLVSATRSGASAVIGNHALFAGGINSANVKLDLVQVFNV